MHKAISVLQYLADCERAVSVKELAYSLNIPSASCYRLVRTLLEHNWVREVPEGGLRIAFGVAHVARSYSEVEALVSELEVPIRRLANDLGMSVKVSLREGHYATTALRAEPARPNAITSPIGYRFHLTIGSAAAVLLAQLSDEEVELILQTAPDEAWKRQAREDVWSRIRDCRVNGVCCDLGLQHPSIFAMSVPLKLSDLLTVALTAVGWKEDFESHKREVITKHLTSVALSLGDL
ncbi:IclR family transcriptional regulator [Rubellicoccus peritrichatus]|uniref:Helix-turn-helix domain-containing protein n=1 Tax=Rubellicoccus peritrichatus TaxID=3080537 RepID=A0AAQ3QTE2_9BACT|nr:helix-turn-helix domain-containing protein [Puniceicoccus sp. CR14]WOO43613.1 helix-turn-helix domain-containing protein [Puniceicoccus sp. CR14]